MDKGDVLAVCRECPDAFKQGCCYSDIEANRDIYLNPPKCVLEHSQGFTAKAMFTAVLLEKLDKGEVENKPKVKPKPKSRYKYRKYKSNLKNKTKPKRKGKVKNKNKA